MHLPNASLLHRGVLEVIDESHLKKRLLSGEKLRIKLGIDPSKPDLHIGHAVPLRKMREFQDAGHLGVLIIGDTTAQIGDPTDRSEARKILSPEEVKQNAAGYLDQAYKIINKDKTEVHWQSEWFDSFTLRQTMELLASTTVNHLLSHETFAARLKSNAPFHMHEMIYPLLQGYDSVMVKSDVELGASDQKFNILMGRTIQRAHNQPEQDVVILPYLPGTDGQAKMSKSLGNTINLNDTPEDMFGKVMSIPDNLIMTYFELATEIDEEEIADIEQQLKQSTTNPRDIKEKLAKTIVTEYYDASSADQAATAFDSVFRRKEVPEDIEELKLSPMNYDLIDILVNRISLVTSKSEARRLIEQGGVKKNNQVVTDISEMVTPNDGQTVVIQVGPRRFVKVTWSRDS
jgi:tyrosyl-tRNA synthetase